MHARTHAHTRTRARARVSRQCYGRNILAIRLRLFHSNVFFSNQILYCTSCGWLRCGLGGRTLCTHIVFSIIVSSEYRDVYGIMWKNMVQPYRPPVTV